VQSATFLGEVQDGQIVTNDPLIEFEGKQVFITLIAPDPSSPTPDGDRHELPTSPFAPEEPVILEDLGRLRIPARDVATLKARITDVGPLSPNVYPSDEEE
jgi:hypothetical protein